MALSGLFHKLFQRNRLAVLPGESEDSTNGRSIEIVEPYTLEIREIEAGFYRTLLPDPVVGETLSVPQKLVQGMVRQNLNKEEFRRRAVPRLPSVIPRLLRSLRDPETSAGDYVAIINKDPTMSAAVLKLANSVYFNPTDKSIASIERAVVKLGIEGLRSVLSAAVMQPMIQRSSPYFTEFGQRLWQHSLHCAVACEIIAKQQGLEPYKAYMMGLTHDIGKITIFSELCKGYKLNADKDPLGYQAFVPLLRKVSAPLSHLIAKSWELPEVICTAQAQQSGLKAGVRVGHYGHVLFQANLVCEAVMAADQLPPKAPQKLVRAMSLPEHLLPALRQL